MQRKEDIGEEAMEPTKPQNTSEDANESEKFKQKNKKLSKKSLEKLKAEHERKGVVYISRIPPHMKPQKLRHMLEEHAEIGRVYLAAEDKDARRKRKKTGKDTGKNFTEGWVEFLDKKEAKRVAAALNGQIMGGKRRSSYYYDLWNIKYLPKFKWDHLTEEINYQRAVQEQKIAVEIAAANRERDFYLSRVDKAKAVEAIIERKRKLPDDADNSGDGDVQKQQKKKGQQQKKENKEDKGPRVLRTYAQRQAKPELEEKPVAVSQSLLRMIASKE